MSSSSRKSQKELDVFREFVEQSGLPVDSMENRDPPEPDILCHIRGQGFVAFELKGLTDEDIARDVAEQLRSSKSTEAIWTEDPTPELQRKAKDKKYTTDHPIELLVYSVFIVTPPDVIISQLRRGFEDGSSHVFRRVWFMGYKDEPCICVYDRHVI